MRGNSENPNDDDDSVVVIDVGKTFLAAAQELFPLYGLRKIAAVVLTHAHADGESSLSLLQSGTRLTTIALQQ